MIRVLVDDLAFLEVDAVLRPADDRLDPVTPAMSRLDQSAGPGFLEQRRISAPLAPGAAVVTGAGALAADFIIHVVIQSENEAIGRDAVRRALLSAWQRASDWKLARLAAPLVGCGPGGLSLEEATSLLVDTFRPLATATGWPAELAIVVERPEEGEIVEGVLRSLK